MKNHIIFFSGGKSSFSVADYVKEHYPNDNVLLYFTDTLWEDEDLYRFIYEVSDKLELPMLIHSRGVNPAQLMVQQKFMANSRVGTCSVELKMKVSKKFIKDGIVPEIEKWHNKQFLKSDNFRDDPILYFGIGFEEMHREEPIRRNWKPFKVAMPHIENIIDNSKVLRKYNIKQPRMYDMQFVHNNCKGRCVKAGQGHFKNLLMKDYDTFKQMKELEILLSHYIRYTRELNGETDFLKEEMEIFATTGEKSSRLQQIINNNKHDKNLYFGGRSEPYTFMKNKSLEDIEQMPIQCDIWDIGGCGCFVDDERLVREALRTERDELMDRKRH